MKRYFICDDYGDFDTDELKVSNESKAIDKADATWERLTDHDKNRRESFYLISINSEDVENDIPNLDKADVVKEYK